MDFNRLNDFEPNSPENLQMADNQPNADRPEPPADGLELKPKKQMWTYKAEHLIESPNGLNLLFKTCTMENETVGSLKGKGHEVSDLNKIVATYKTWHLKHCPKLEYHLFLDKVRNMGRKEVSAYVQRLRNHYKGDEILEEFQ